MGPHPQREVGPANPRGRFGASRALFGPIFLIFGATGEVSKKHVFLTWAKIDQKAVTIASWPPKARFLVDFHPPHPPGAGRVKLEGTSGNQV